MKTIKEIIEANGTTQTELAKRFGIPLRTVQDWVAGRRTPPLYVTRLIAAALKGGTGNDLHGDTE